MKLFLIILVLALGSTCALLLVWALVRLLKPKSKRCSVWWCLGNKAGYVQISADLPSGVKTKKIPYCETHGEVAKEVIKERYPDGVIVKPQQLDRR